MRTAAGSDEGRLGALKDDNPGRAERGGKGRRAALAHRWPTALAVGLAAVTLEGGDSDVKVAMLTEILVILPLIYLLVAAMQRRGATWPLLAVLTIALFVLRTGEWVAPTTVFVAGALGVLVWGAVRGRLHRPGAFRVQAVGMVGFGALAVAGLTVDADLGRYLVAAGWFGHGVWDFVHLRTGKVVARSYAEWCGVLDILIAAGLVLLL